MALIKCSDCGTEVSDAAAACPKCARPIAAQPASTRAAPAKKKSSLSPVGITIAIVIGIIVWVNLPSSKSDSSSGPQTSSTDTGGSSASGSNATTSSDAQPEIVIKTPVELYQEYTANEVATDQSLAGKLVQITAPVKSIDKDFADSAVLHFATGNEFSDLQATLLDSEKARAGSLARGQIVTVRCKTMHRIVDSPMGDDCTFVEAPKSGG
jgi:uncharacterized membrane protein YvbJ